MDRVKTPCFSFVLTMERDTPVQYIISKAQKKNLFSCGVEITEVSLSRVSWWSMNENVSWPFSSSISALQQNDYQFGVSGSYIYK